MECAGSVRFGCESHRGALDPKATNQNKKSRSFIARTDSRLPPYMHKES